MRRPERSASIRALLLRLVLVCFLPSAVGALVLFGFEYHRRDEQMKSSLVATTRALTQALDSQLKLGQAIAHTLATSRNLTDRNFAHFHVQATAALKNSGVSARVSVIDRDGSFILNTRQPYGTPLPKPFNAAQISRIFETGEEAISNVFIGAVARQPVVVLYAPVIEGGKVIMLVSVELEGRSLGRILGAELLPDDWLSSILDASGKIVARTQNPDQFLAELPRPEVLEGMRQSREGTFIARTREGVPSLYAYSRSSRTNWSVNIAVPQSIRQAELLRSTWPLALGIFLLLVISLAMTRRISRCVTDAVQGLRAPAVALGTGEPFAETHSEVTEVNEVAHSMAQAGRLLEERTRALQEGERRLNLALEAGNSAVWELDVATDIVQGGAGLFSMLGYGPGEIRTLSDWVRLIHEDDLEGIPELLADAVEGRTEGYRYETRVRRKDGNWSWTLSQARVAERDKGGRATRIVGTHTNIDSRKRAEAEIKRLNAELEERVHERTAELEQANEALLRSNIELQSFAYVTAHDLQTPLRSIAGFSQLVQAEARQYGNADIENWTTQIVDNARRLHALIQSLLSYTRLDNQGAPFKEVDIGELLKEVLGSLQGLIAATGAEVVCGRMPVVRGDKIHLGQLFQNLIENGIKYHGDTPPRIQVASELEGSDWLFSVKDNGIGIDPRHHERIFGIFKRLHSYSEVPGSGIGLSMCRRIVEQHGGRIWVESKPGEGSTFYFTLLARE